MAFPHPASLSSSPAPINLRLQPLPSIALLHPTALRPFWCSLPLNLPALRLNRPRLPPLPLASSDDSGSGFTGSGGDDEDLPPSGGGGGGGGDEGHGEGEHDEGGDDDASINKRDALFVLAQLGRKLDSLPADLAAAVEAGRIPGEIVQRYADLEAKPFFRWLMQFSGFKERLLADDLLLTKVGIECGVGLFTKTAAEFQKRGDKFMEELDFVISDVVMAIVADFMLVWIPSPTVSLQPPLVTNSGAIAKFFYNCPENGFQVALAGTSYSLLQRVGAIVRNGVKLFAVGTSASLIATGVITALKKARKAVSKDSDGGHHNVNILNYSMAYGVYMAVSSNLRYQIVAGVLEQRILEPLLHNHKVVLSAVCFAVRTGNTFFGSLLWIDYARLIELQ